MWTNLRMTISILVMFFMEQFNRDVGLKSLASRGISFIRMRVMEELMLKMLTAPQ